MTKAQMERRIIELETAVNELRRSRIDEPDPRRPWWTEDAGRFNNDPIFDEIVRLGRQYRESLRPRGSARSRRSDDVAPAVKKPVGSGGRKRLVGRSRSARS